MNDQTPQILVPLDGSALAEAVLPHAVGLAQAMGRALTLAQVVAPSSTLLMLTNPALAPSITSDDWFTRARQDAEIYLNGVAKRLKTAAVPVHAEVLVGENVAGTLVAYTMDKNPATLITMATHGRSGLRKVLMGSVAQQVLHMTPVPLLLVRAGHNNTGQHVLTYRKICVTLDGSPFAEQALERAKPLAAALDAELVLVGVGPGIGDSSLADAGITPMWMLAEQEATHIQLGNYLQRQTRRLEAEGLRTYARFVHGVPATEILRVGTEEQADLIVMATHGHSGLTRLFLGSVAQEVMRNACLPVMLVPAVERSKRRETVTVTRAPLSIFV